MEEIKHVIEISTDRSSMILAAGLGEWQVNKKKLPNGITTLCDAAEARNLKFGIWVEPEMVNPASELYENHPEWVIHQPNREKILYRNQLVLDLSNPEVQDFIYDSVAALSYVSEDKTKAVAYAYTINHMLGALLPPLTLKGLDPQKHYLITEINTSNGNAHITRDGKVLRGDVLMNHGLKVNLEREYDSAVFELTEA